MQVLIITTMYAPDLGPAAPLVTMLSEGLVKLGHQVTVITTVPHYPSGQVPATFRGKLLWRSRENGVELIRIGLPSVNRKNLSQRLIQIVYFQLIASFVNIGHQYDVVLSGTPSIAVLLPYLRFVVLSRKPAIYSVHDVYPDVGVALGIFRHKLMIKAVAILERFCLNHAKLVRILSESFRTGLHKLGVPDTKMVLIYDWVDIDLIQPLPRENLFSSEYGIADRFTVLYAGNIGLSQGLENIIATAELLIDHKDIVFVFVGDGAGREFLQSQAMQKQLSNVQFVPFQPRQRLPEVLASADISLVILRQGIGSASLPSKTFSIMASGRPILVSVDEESETTQLIKRAEAGLWVPAEDPRRTAEAILSLRNNKALLDQLGHNGRIWAEHNHSPQNAVKQFEKLFRTAISMKNASLP